MTEQQPAPEIWWYVDHFKSDNEYHTYCGICYEQIPGFLVRWSQQWTPPYANIDGPLCCEGCKKEAAA